MIQLKDYQQRALDSLRGFFRDAARDRDPAKAFRVATEKAGMPAPYIPVSAAGLEGGMPYVCLRVPTGGGKTLMACHAVGLAMTEFMRAERAVALWLVPSLTILDQTADALRDSRHPYRRALELACGAVEVLTISEALHLSRADADGKTVVIVSTIQAFKAEDTTGRKVFGQAGFMEHFLGVPPERLQELLPGADGKPCPSLVNALRLRRPIVIVDEAHNARTDLSFTALGHVAPSCIVEFTATPDQKRIPSNVLHRVSAAELKAAKMVKLPLRVITRPPSQKGQLLAEALTLRADLEKIAVTEGQRTNEYIRPILLIQAEKVDACEPLRERLTAEFGLAKDEVKISVGKLDELKDVRDISSPKCPVRVIITVEKLREGWDCPFAYVLCSLKETRSATAIEQIVGRILRLPNAQSKDHPDLNCAYAFSPSASLPEVLAELREALESNGFTAAEAERIILPVPQGVLPLGAQPQTVTLVLGRELDVDAARAQVAALAGKARLDETKGALTIIVPLDEGETARLVDCARTPQAKAVVREAVAAVRAAERAFGGTGETRPATPFERGLDFTVPLLCVREGRELIEFDETFLLERPLKLSEKDASLPDAYNPLVRPTAKSGLLDVGSKGDVQASVVKDASEGDFVGALHRQVLMLGAAEEWAVESLAAWLDRKIEHQDIPVAESADFMGRVIRGLMTKFGMADVGPLAQDRFRLRDHVATRIQAYREEERKNIFREFLLPSSSLAVDEGRVLDFKSVLYEPSWRYEGGFQFQKHYFGPKPGELRELTDSRELTEEFRCAQFIDGSPDVSYWVRNLARKAGSFRLQTSDGWFYPDFLCRLVDGRVMVVEYKGGHLYADAEEKRIVGQVWASRSGGRCLFVMPTNGDFDGIVRMLRK